MTVGKKNKTLTRRELIKRLDRLTSFIVRYQNLGGPVRCVSTGKMFPVDQIDAGHFIARGCLPLRFNLINVNPESVGANRFSPDHLVGYANTLVKRHGADILDQLLEVRDKWRKGEIKVSTTELRDLYKARLKSAKKLQDTMKSRNIKANYIPEKWFSIGE